VNVWARVPAGRGLAILTWPLPQLVSAADATPDSFRPGVLSSGGVAASSQSLSRESQDLHQADALQADGFPGTRALLPADATQRSGITLNEANFIADKLKAAGGYSGVVGLLDFDFLKQEIFNCGILYVDAHGGNYLSRSEHAEIFGIVTSTPAGEALDAELAQDFA